MISFDVSIRSLLLLSPKFATLGISVPDAVRLLTPQASCESLEPLLRASHAGSSWTGRRAAALGVPDNVCWNCNVGPRLANQTSPAMDMNLSVFSSEVSHCVFQSCRDRLPPSRCLLLAGWDGSRLPVAVLPWPSASAAVPATCSS